MSLSTSEHVLEKIKELAGENDILVISKDSLISITGYSKPTLNRAIKMLLANKKIDVAFVGKNSAYKVNGCFFESGADVLSVTATVIIRGKEQPNNKD